MLEVRHQAAVDRLVAVLRAHVDERRSSLDDDPMAFPELDCLRGLLSDQTLAVADRNSRAVGVGADRVLIHAGMIDEELYVRALADELGIEFEMFELGRREACPLSGAQLVDASRAGVLPVVLEKELAVVMAPQSVGARGLSDFLRSYPHLGRRFRLTTSERLHAFVSKHGQAAISERAVSALRRIHPDLSAAPSVPGFSRRLMAAVGCALTLALITAPGPTIFAFDIALSLFFLAWAMLRLSSTLTVSPAISVAGYLPDVALPVYSVLVPLYREASSVKGLITALRKLAYPREKLDIKLIVERDDHETLAAIKRQWLGAEFQIIVAPEGAPRTKPKALNATLPFVRGSFVVVYDAEDRPEIDQLHRALDAFLAHGERLACVQASLTIDNNADNWLTALFAAEYAAQFDVFLPALSSLAAPLPLGGSSNHFRTSALRAVGAWDPYNVTEDADLGLRLARFGYQAMAIQSSTYEEAPSQLGPWLRQRTRWFKGWMQTWLVHTRAPTRLWRELGPFRFAVVQLIVGGNVLASLVHPVMLFWLMCAALLPQPIFASGPTAVLFTTTIAAGYAASALLGGLGLYRRGLMKHGWVLFLLPIHWLLLSIASWRALCQLLRDPYRWEKTEHGLARTSRRTTTGAETTKPPRTVPATASSSRLLSRVTER